MEITVLILYSFPEGIYNVAVTCSHERDGCSYVGNENESLREKFKTLPFSPHLHTPERTLC